MQTQTKMKWTVQQWIYIYAQKIIKNNPKQTTVYTYKTKGEEWSSGTKHPRTLQLSSEGAIRAVKYFTETFKLWESEYSVLCHSLWLALWPFAALTPPFFCLSIWHTKGTLCWSETQVARWSRGHLQAGWAHTAPGEGMVAHRDAATSRTHAFNAGRWRQRMEGPKRSVNEETIFTKQEKRKIMKMDNKDEPVEKTPSSGGFNKTPSFKSRS